MLHVTKKQSYSTAAKEQCRYEQELIYRKQVVRQLCTEYAEGIYDNPVTLKSRLTVTQVTGKGTRVDHIRLTIRRVTDVEYYRHLESWSKIIKSLKLVPFDSLGVVSYLPSIVTVAVSVAICKIFSVKEWRDLDNHVRSRSSSLKMAPFDRPYATFYWSAIANIALFYIALSCTIFDFLTLNNIVTLKSGLEVIQCH